MLKVKFSNDVDMREVHDTGRLAMMAVESMYGDVLCLLSVQFKTDHAARTVLIDMGTKVGQDLAAIFLGFVRREFGEESVAVSSV